MHHILMLFQDELCVSSHISPQFTAGVIDGYSHHENSYVVLLHTHRRKPGQYAIKGLVLKELHLDTRRLAEIDLANIALVYLALHINLTNVAQCHNQCRGGAEH